MEKMKIPKLLLCILILLNFNIVHAQTVHNFRVQQAVEFAKKNNAQVKNAFLNIKIQEQTNRNITAAAFPTIS